MFAPRNFPLMKVSASLFCTRCKYLDRVTVLFFRDIIEYEDFWCLFSCRIFPAMTRLLQE